MSDLDGLINLIPIGDIAKKLGIDENTAKAAVAVAVPAIVGGLAANASTGAGASKLETVLSHHEGNPTDPSKVDAEDGKKIVSHVFGSQTKEVEAAVAQKAGGPDIGAIVQQLLPILAPIVLSLLATQLSKGSAAPASTPAAAEPAASGGIGDLLGGLLGSKQGQDVVGGLLGGLLGGKK